MAQLVHGLKLINEPTLHGLAHLIEHNIKADCVITVLRPEYLKPEGDITVEDIIKLLDLLAHCTHKGTHLYMELKDKELLPLMKEAFAKCNHYILRNTLILPTDIVIEEHVRCRTTKFIDSDFKYVLFACNGHYPRTLLGTPYDLETVHCSGCRCGSHYLANWATWFHKEEIEAYKVMAQISTHHGERILDPFMHRGHIASKVYEADREYIGIEPNTILCKEVATMLDEQGE